MTISYQELSQEQKPWGLEVTIELSDSETGLKGVKTVRFKDQADKEAQGPARLNHIKYNFELNCNPLARFDLGIDPEEGKEGAKEILVQLVKYIRNNPGCNLEQVKTLYDNNYPDAPWRADAIVNHAKRWLRQTLGFVPTWDQFKNYVINHKFGELDPEE